MNNDEMTVADLLDETGVYIHEHGWLQDTMVDDGGKVCTVGGLIGVRGGDWSCYNDDPLVLAATQALVTHLHLPWNHEHCIQRHKDAVCLCYINAVTSWNDEDATTEQEVIDALHKAAKIERNGGIDPDA